MKKLIGILTLSLLLLTACGETTQGPSSTESDTQTDQKLSIVTTFPPLYSFTKNIVGDEVEVTNLVPPGTSVHVWEPKPGDLKALADADLLVMNGLGLEPFIDDMIDSAQNQSLTVVTTTDAVKDHLMEYNAHNDHEHEDDHEHDDEDDHEHEDDHGHSHEGPDPHIWLSPELALEQVELISDQIVKLDPENSETYETNTQAYLTKLKSLDDEIAKQLSEVEAKGFIVFHDAYSYFLHHYELDDHMRAAVEPFAGKEPTAAYFNDLIKLIEDQGVEIVFTEPQFNPTVVQNLEEETSIKSYEIDPIGLELSAESYENNMRDLADSFIKAFKQNGTDN